MNHRIPTVALLLVLASCAGSEVQRPVAAPDPAAAANPLGPSSTSESPAPGSADAPIPNPTSLSYKQAVEPGKFFEINLELPAGAVVDMSFAADMPLDWNLHVHPDGDVQLLMSGTDAGGSRRYTAPAADTYSFLWENKSALPATLFVSVLMSEGARLHSLHPKQVESPLGPPLGPALDPRK